MNRESVKRLVKAKLEEFSPFEEPEQLLAVANNDVKPVDSYIEETIDGAFDKVLLAVPLTAIRETKIDFVRDVSHGSFSVSSLPDDPQVGVMPVPKDFLRLYSLRASCWQREVNSPIDTQSHFYILQRNKHTRGGHVKPIVVMNNGKFELYSIKDPSAVIRVFVYVPKTKRKGMKADDGTTYTEGEQTFEDSLVDFLVLQCATDILNIFEQYDKANTLKNELNELIKSKVL